MPQCTYCGVHTPDHLRYAVSLESTLRAEAKVIVKPFCPTYSKRMFVRSIVKPGDCKPREHLVIDNFRAANTGGTIAEPTKAPVAQLRTTLMIPTSQRRVIIFDVYSITRPVQRRRKSSTICATLSPRSDAAPHISLKQTSAKEAGSDTISSVVRFRKISYRCAWNDHPHGVDHSARAVL